MKDPMVLLWVFFVSKGLKDEIDIVRALNLCLTICNTPYLTVDTIKDSSAYKSCAYDIPEFVTDEYLLQMILFDE